MGLIVEFDGSIEGYEAVPLLPPDGAEWPGWGGAVLRRRSARPSRRAVLYVHALDDDFVREDQVAWYTERGFHFYVADLRPTGDSRLDRSAPATGGPDRPAGVDRGPAPPAARPAPDPAPQPSLPPDPVPQPTPSLDPVPQPTPSLDPAPQPTPPPAAWDTATFDAITFDEAVQERAPYSGPPARIEPARPLPSDVARAAEELGECFASLDAAVDHLRGREAIGSVVVAAHSAGALVAALWAHARQGSRPVDALILANPSIGDRQSWLARMRALREESVSGRRLSPLLTGARRRVRRGLDIPCPVLVMSPAGVDATGGGWLASRLRIGDPVPPRLGAHVTWLTLDGGLPGQLSAGGPERRQYFEELTRWLGAYLSGQIRDQLL